MIEDYENRHIPFEGCFNFRDIGGYRTSDGREVQWGRYYRAGRQDRMTAIDVDRVQDLGIRTQIDLRKSDEVGEPRQRVGGDKTDILGRFRPAAGGDMDPVSLDVSRRVHGWRRRAVLPD